MTLTEVLVAIAILSVAVLTVVGGLQTASWTSDLHRKQVNADTVVRSFAEAIKKRVSVGVYVPCPPNLATAKTVYTPEESTWEPMDSYPIDITGIKYLTSSGSFSTTPCSTDLGAQMLTLQASSSDGKDTETLEIVIRTP